MSDNKENSFFEFDDEVNSDISLTKDELFSIIDQSNDKNLFQRKSNINIKDYSDIQQHLEDFGEIIAIFSIDELEQEYKKKSKLKYYINDDVNEDTFKHNSDRNILLDKFSEQMTSHILDENQDSLIDDKLELIETDEDSEKNDKNAENESETTNLFPTPSFSEDIIEEFNQEEINSIIQYIEELIENLPEDKVKEFINSDYYKLYKKIKIEIID